MRYYRFKYVARILIRKSRSPFHPPTSIYMKCIVSLWSWYFVFHSIASHCTWLRSTICALQFIVIEMWGGRGGGMEGSNMLITAAHAFCLDYAQRPQVDPSIGWFHSGLICFWVTILASLFHFLIAGATQLWILCKFPSEKYQFSAEEMSGSG